MQYYTKIIEAVSKAADEQFPVLTSVFVTDAVRIRPSRIRQSPPKKQVGTN